MNPRGHALKNFTASAGLPPTTATAQKQNRTLGPKSTVDTHILENKVNHIAGSGLDLGAVVMVDSSIVLFTNFRYSSVAGESCYNFKVRVVGPWFVVDCLFLRNAPTEKRRNSQTRGSLVSPKLNGNSRARIILIRVNRFTRIDSQEIPICTTVIHANRGQPHHSRFYPQSTRRIISLGSDSKARGYEAMRRMGHQSFANRFTRIIHDSCEQREWFARIGQLRRGIYGPVWGRHVNHPGSCFGG